MSMLNHLVYSIREIMNESQYQETRQDIPSGKKMRLISRKGIENDLHLKPEITPSQLALFKEY